MTYRYTLPPAPLPGVNSSLLAPGDTPLLQAFLDRLPEYFIAVTGAAAEPDEAEREITDLPPADYPFGEKYVIGYCASDGNLIAVANVITELFAPTVWHLATFYLATERHGNGDAALLYRSLEQWATTQGARWIRLGVVIGNQRAQRFWQRCGFRPVRVRHSVRMGQRDNDILVMCKSLYDEELGSYLALVEHDRDPP